MAKTWSMLSGGALLGGAMALTGCMSGGTTGGATADLAWVPASIDGSTDVFLDHGRLITSEQLGASTTAIPVDVSIDDLTITATRLGSDEILASWEALEVASVGEVFGATPIDGELNPGENTPIVVPGDLNIRFRGGSEHGTVPGNWDRPGLIVDWSEVIGSIPNSIDSELLNGIDAAHPGCA